LTHELKDGTLLTEIENTDLLKFRRTREFERVRREGEAINILGISTTMMAPGYVRPSTSESALEKVLDIVKNQANVKSKVPAINTVMLKLREIEFGFCAGYYSQKKEACEWPCALTVTEYMRKENAEKKGLTYQVKDRMDLIYKALLWADIVFVATPIRFGNAGSLYYKMVERLNSVHNEMTLRDHQVMREKVAGFIIIGGQDGVQAVAGQMLTFWSELGFIFSRYSYVGWNRGWYAEDTSKNPILLASDKEFEKDLHKLADFAMDLKMRLDAAPTRLLDDYEQKTLIVNDDYKKYDPDARSKDTL